MNILIEIVVTHPVGIFALFTTLVLMGAFMGILAEHALKHISS